MARLGLSCAEPRVAHHDPDRSLPIQHIPRLSDTVKMQEKNKGKKFGDTHTKKVSVKEILENCCYSLGITGILEHVKL